jgi:hypothetical protein
MAHVSLDKSCDSGVDPCQLAIQARKGAQVQHTLRRQRVVLKRMERLMDKSGRIAGHRELAGTAIVRRLQAEGFGKRQCRFSSL